MDAMPELATKVLDVRVEALPASHPGTTPSLTDLLPHPGRSWAWLAGDHGLVGVGEAVRVTVEGRHALRDAARAWDGVRRAARVRSTDEEAPRVPVALGSFGFAWATPGLLVVPRLTVIEKCDRTGTARRYAVSAAPIDEGAAPDPLAALEEVLAAREDVARPSGLWTEPGRMSQGQWMESVRRLISLLRGGAASKVVMSRDMVVSAAAPIDERHLLTALRDLYPTTWGYAVAGLVGATPELLASMSDGLVRSRVLAGTTRPGEGEALMNSMKDRTEHLLAVESVARALAPIAETLDVPETPFLLDLPNVSHLATDVTATVTGANVLDVVAALHPTAAVCGTPTKLAFDLLESFEATRRGRYSGPVGWIDAAGDGEFGIALRCGQLDEARTRVRVFAGGGIMPDSVPEVELAETRAKMRPLLEALGVTGD